MVGTTNKSMAAICSAWLRRKVLQRWPAGVTFLGHVLGDGRLSHRKAELEQFAMNGAPQSKFSTIIRRIKARKSALICGRPPQVPRFPTPIAAKTGTMPAHQRLGPDDRDHLEDRRKPAIQLDEEQAIAVRELDPTADLPLQHNQLLPERGILGLKSAPGFEQRSNQVRE